MDLSGLLDTDWSLILEKLKTENVVEFLGGTDPVSILLEPKYAIPAVILGLCLYFFHFRKTLIFIVGMVVIWYAVAHYLPKGELLELHDILAFASLCIAVLATWIYYFFIRGD